MMPADCYKVQVIHFLNPHLLWVVLKDSKYVLEQIGIYGILPQEQIIDIETEDLKLRECKEWIPAANNILKVFCDHNVEVWFSPTHIDRRSSIFDDNVHKYGDLLIKTEKGKYKKLSKTLVKSGFAYNNVCEFLIQLSTGKIKTKLSAIKMQEVMRELETFCIRGSIPRSLWEESLRKQTSVFQSSQNLESSLTVSNLEKHNNPVLNTVLENKNKDFELCKGIEEKSLGRGFSKYELKRVSKSEENRSHFLKKKLAMAKVKSTKSIAINDSYIEIKRFLDTNSQLKESSAMDFETDNSSSYVENSSSINMKLEENILHLHNLQQITKEKRSFTLNKSNKEIYRPLDTYKKDHNKNLKTKTFHNFAKIKGIKSGYDITETIPDGTLQILSRGKESDINAVRYISYGPPDINPQKLKLQSVEDNDFEGSEPELTFNKEDSQKYDSKILFEEVDSDIGAEIAKKNLFHINLKMHDNIQENSFNKTEKQIKTEGRNARNREEIKGSECSSDKNTSSSNSMLLERKLKAHKISRKHSTRFSTSNPLKKDSSSENGKQSDDDDDDDIENIINRLHLEYADSLTQQENKIAKDVLIEKEVNVNPFKNIDNNISVFVDKLVTPILMVHSKHNRYIRPVFEMRDIYFNDHIYAILKNMSIQRPMMLQTVSWSKILRGYSLFMISPMGSGKTLGYLPAVCRLVSDSNSDRSFLGPICIIVCATARSVANVERIAKMFLKLDERVLACYAGVDNLHISTTLLNGCDLLICTPSSLVRLMEVTDFGVDLRRLTTFVLDDCERLGSVYTNEIKFFMYKIKDMLKSRANKELKVQYIVASRMWCDFMGPLAKKVPDTVICIGAFQECVLYSKANTSVSFVKSENKVDAVFEFLKEVDLSKRSVIVCNSDDEIKLLETALKRMKHVYVIACDNTMTVHDLYRLSIMWADYYNPLIGPILLCCDGNLMHMNVTDAHNLLHFSLPPLYSMFCKRFSVLNDNYPSIFRSDNEVIKIKILLEESNFEQLPKILNFIKRCTDNVPDFLNTISFNILKEKDAIKAKNFVPVCDNLLALGYCPDLYNCNERHTILKDYDSPKEWLPKEGLVTFKILHYHTATLYSARLLSNTVNGKFTNYPQSYSSLSLKMGMFYSKESNKKLHGIPKIGDICAASMKLNFFARCQVIKIISRYERGNPNNVLVKLIDEEKYDVTRDIDLYYLPEDLRQIETRVVQVRLTNIVPKDKDVTFSYLARDYLQKLTSPDTDLIIRGNVSLTVGNCIFVDTLEACQELTSLNETVVKCNLKKELLESHALSNPTHLSQLEKLCNECGLIVKKEPGILKTEITVKNQPEGTWAHLQSDTLTSVFVASVLAPDSFFVRLDKFDSGMTSLIDDIQNHIKASSPINIVAKEGQMVLAKFPDDSTYERARIDSIAEDKVKCFFVDHGDWIEVSVNDIFPITDQFINQLPFQAIECRLIGIKPAGSEWTEFSTNWFHDQCFEDENGRLKHLFVKYFTNEPAEFTSGHKYGVILIDTTTEQDIIVNQLMIDLNLAQENEFEMKYLNNFDLVVKDMEHKQPSDNENDDWEKVSDINSTQSNYVVKSTNQTMSKLFQKPLRSVPLVGSDSESDDLGKWDVIGLFPGLQGLQNLNENGLKQNDNSTISNPIPKSGQIIQNPVETKELDSDDLTSPDSTCYRNHLLSKTPDISELYKKRRPKLVWRQNKSNVVIKIQLIGVDNYKLLIEERVLNFTANANDINYAFEIELYGVINKDNSSHVNKGQYILVTLSKIFNKTWLTLARDGGIKKWIVYDVDDLNTSSEDEAEDDITEKNIVKGMHGDLETDSDDEEMVDEDNYIKNK